MAIEAQSMDGRGSKECQPLPKSKLQEIDRGSMVQVIDPEGVWYWVIVERRYKDGLLQGRIDAHCLIGPALRHRGTVVFNEDNVFFVWPVKVDQVFNSLWFRFFSGWLSMRARAKALKRFTDSYPTPKLLYFSDRIFP